MKVLAEPFIVQEHERVVLPDRRAQRYSELVSLKPRGGTRIEEIGSVHGVVAQVFVYRSVECVGPGLSDDQDLCSGTLAVLGAIRVPEDVELSHCIDAEQFLAGSSGLHVVFRGAGEFNSIQQENIL